MRSPMLILYFAAVGVALCGGTRITSPDSNSSKTIIPVFFHYSKLMFPVELTLNAPTVSSLKKGITKITGIPVEKQQVLTEFGYKEMEDTEYAIEEYSVRLVLNNSKNMQAYTTAIESYLKETTTPIRIILNIDGKKQTAFYVTSDSTHVDIQNKVARKIGLTDEQAKTLRLDIQFGGKSVVLGDKESNTLSKSGITGEAIVNIGPDDQNVSKLLQQVKQRKEEFLAAPDEKEEAGIRVFSAAPENHLRLRREIPNLTRELKQHPDLAKEERLTKILELVKFLEKEAKQEEAHYYDSETKNNSETKEHGSRMDRLLSRLKEAKYLSSKVRSDLETRVRDFVSLTVKR